MKYYELDCGKKYNGKDTEGCEVVRGLIDAYFNIVIELDHYPTFEEAEFLVKEKLLELGYDGIYGITPITEEEYKLYTSGGCTYGTAFSNLY